jgi:hypothetical protein
MSFDANAPISVTYINSSKELSRTYLRARGQTLFATENPSAFDVYVSVVGSYYAFDRKYPLVNQGILQFLDYCILQKEELSNKSTLLKNCKMKYNKLIETLKD